MFSTLTLLVFIVVVVIYSLVYTAYDDYSHKKEQKAAKRSGYVTAIIYKLEDETEIILGPTTWVKSEAERTADMMAKNNQGISSILNHRDFKKVTGEEFDPEKMRIEKLKKGSANDFVRYDNEGIEYPPHETSYM